MYRDIHVRLDRQIGEVLELLDGRPLDTTDALVLRAAKRGLERLQNGDSLRDVRVDAIDLLLTYAEGDHSAYKLKSFYEEIKEFRGRRLHACQNIRDIRTTIEALPIDEKMRRELVNLSSLLLRLILLHNDGNVSHQELPAF